MDQVVRMARGDNSLRVRLGSKKVKPETRYTANQIWKKRPLWQKR